MNTFLWRRGHELWTVFHKKAQKVLWQEVGRLSGLRHLNIFSFLSSVPSSKVQTANVSQFHSHHFWRRLLAQRLSTVVKCNHKFSSAFFWGRRRGEHSAFPSISGALAWHKRLNIVGARYSQFPPGIIQHSLVLAMGPLLCRKVV